MKEEKMKHKRIKCKNQVTLTISEESSTFTTSTQTKSTISKTTSTQTNFKVTTPSVKNSPEPKASSVSSETNSNKSILSFLTIQKGSNESKLLTTTTATTEPFKELPDELNADIDQPTSKEEEEEFFDAEAIDQSAKINSTTDDSKATTFPDFSLDSIDPKSSSALNLNKDIAGFLSATFSLDRKGEQDVIKELQLLDLSEYMKPNTKAPGFKSHLKDKSSNVKAIDKMKWTKRLIT